MFQRLVGNFGVIRQVELSEIRHFLEPFVRNSFGMINLKLVRTELER